MPIPAATLKAYEKTRVDLAIESFMLIEKPTSADIAVLRTQASIQNSIDTYRIDALNMTEKERLNECHKSNELAKHMTLASDPKPHPLCHCHAIIAGAHSESAVLRAVLAWVGMRIDDPRNGCWLPRNTAARAHMPLWLRNSIPHSRIHRKSYYRWVEGHISITLSPNIEALTTKLRMIRSFLQNGILPGEILSELGYEARTQ